MHLCQMRAILCPVCSPMICLESNRVPRKDPETDFANKRESTPVQAWTRAWTHVTEAAHLIISATKTSAATPRPSFPRTVATTFNLDWRGVSLSSFSFKVAITLPHSVLMPTAVTRKRPKPSVTLQPLMRNGWLRSLCTGSLSPVMLDSSTVRECPAMKTPSAGTCKNVGVS